MRTTPAVREAAPVYRFAEAAQKVCVSQEAAWAMWRVVFPKATRTVFRGVWADVAKEPSDA